MSDSFDTFPHADHAAEVAPVPATVPVIAQPTAAPIAVPHDEPAPLPAPQPAVVARPVIPANVTPAHGAATPTPVVLADGTPVLPGTEVIATDGPALTGTEAVKTPPISTAVNPAANPAKPLAGIGDTTSAANTAAAPNTPSVLRDLANDHH